ncbi:MAG: amino acid adenylation domain-containing protein [Polyangiaceae bacterium]
MKPLAEAPQFVDEQPSFALSPEQRGVLSQCGEAGAPTHNHCLALRIEGPLEPQRLRRAFELVVHAHSGLATALRAMSGYRGLRQALVSALELEWQELALDDSLAVSTLVESSRVAPLELARGQVLRVRLVQSSAAEHSLIVVLSALAGDAASLVHLAAQVIGVYAGDAAPEAEQTFQYAQFVEWRAELAGADDAVAGETYWARYLDLSSSSGPRLLAEGGRAALRQRALGRVDATKLHAFARSLEVSPETVLQGVWWALLARLTGFAEFVAGWRHDCRHDYEPMQGAVGVFEKVLPIGVAPKPEQSFVDWARSLHGVALTHVESQEYWELEQPPIQAHFEVGFGVRPALELDSGGARWSIRELVDAHEPFALGLEASLESQRCELRLSADGSRYSRRALEGLLRQFESLLDGVLSAPRAPLASLPLLSVEAQNAALARGFERIDFGTLSVSSQIARWAKLTPDAPAVEAGERRLSYAELAQQVDRAAHWLVARGVTPGALVAISLPRSLELLVALLATWRAGAGYVPLEPDWPAARREALLQDAAPLLVLDAHEFQLDGTALASASTSAALPEVALSDVAYVLYTSGSTGRPKGVVIEHGQLLNYVAAVSAALELRKCRRWGLTGSVVADLGNTALFGALFNGACLVVADSDDMKDADAFARFMKERQIDALKMVPSHLEALLDCDSPQLPRTLVLGGEAAPRTLVERVRSLAPECQLYNHYGPTETTVGVMVHRLATDEPMPELLPLSRALANCRVVVLDAGLQMVPVGGIGEVYVGGAQVCRGYLNQDPPGAFVSAPWASGERLYRTGDRAHVLENGGILLAGRVDHQLKIRGFRVDPAEVEAALLAQPSVRQGVVVALKDQLGQSELIAWVVADAAQDPERIRDELRRALPQSLPPQMLPTRYLFATEFPRLGNGKVDRVVLAARAQAELDAVQRDVTPPRDALEFVIADAMAKLLGRAAIGVQDDFFDLGAHSLLIIKLVARLGKSLSLSVAPVVVFDHPSVAALAEELRRTSTDPSELESAAESHRARLVATRAP